MQHSNPQINLFEDDGAAVDSSVAFADIYSDPKLGRCVDELEERYELTDEITVFASLVNPSISKSQPYHRWARYREAYAGEIVKEIIRRFEVRLESDLVIDPMCGSGSTNVACKEMGIASLGLDVNGYSILLSNAKLADYTDNDIESLESTLIEYAPTTRKRPKYFADVEKFFGETNLAELEKIHGWISSIRKEKIRNFFKTAWLAILEDCSNRRKDGNGLASRPSPVSNVREHFENQVRLMIVDLREHPLPREVFSGAIEGSALDLARHVGSHNPKKHVGAIIFSPPYANSFDYFESYKMELVLGGFFRFSELKEARKKLIRNFRLNVGEQATHKFRIVEGLCEEIRKAIPKKESETGVRDGRTRLVPNMLRCYFDDMHKAISAGYGVLRNGGTMSIVVDQSAYLGLPIPTDLILANIGEEIGFKVEGLTKCRRAGTSGQQLKKFPYLKDLLRESIVTLRK